MTSPVAYYFATFAVISTHNMIVQVKGQCTVQGCQNGDSSNNIVAEIQQLFAEAIRQQQNEQVQYIHELFNASFQQLKNHLQDTVMTSLQAVDRRSQEKDVYIKEVQSINELLNASFGQIKNLNASFQEMKNQQNTITTSLQAIDRRSLGQVQKIHQLLNASFEQMKNQNNTVMRSLQVIDRRSQEQDVYVKQVRSIHELLNASSQQMKNQHASAMRRLDAVIQLLLYLDLSIKNRTHNPWKLAIGLPVQPEFYLGDGPVLLPIANNWIIIMNRFNGSFNFNRTWTEYKNGFGDKERGEFWLGNEIVHRLTNTSGSVYSLRIEVQLSGTGRWFYADYATFSIDSESNKYALRLSGYSGNAGDSLSNTSLPTYGYHVGMSFTTRDSGNDRSGGNCASTGSYPAGWWFNNCWHSCLTCQYGLEFKWYWLTDWQTSGLLRAARMMIKSK